MKWNWTGTGALLGGLAVVCGAFGAHGLKDRLGPAELENWKTAALYHGLHALALVAFGLFAGSARGRSSSAPGWFFFLGILGFSGSLYGHALGGPRALVYATPVGGLLLILGWLLFALAAFRGRAAE